MKAPTLDPEVTGVSYAVPVPRSWFRAIARAEIADLDFDLGARMRKEAGADSVEYNGHFGSAFYFHLAGTGREHGDPLARIQGIIRAGVVEARRINRNERRRKP